MEQIKAIGNILPMPHRSVKLLGYIEVFSRHGKLLHREPITTRGLRIGRAYDNDLILDDPYISPHHIYFYYDGEELAVKDLDSDNGLFIAMNDRHEGNIHISSGDRIKIGHTILKFCELNYTIEDTLIDRPFFTSLKILNHPLSMMLALAITTLYLLFSYYMGTTEKVDGQKIVYIITGFFLAISIWSIFWAFASKVIINKWNLLAHYSIMSVGILAFSLLHALTSYLSFAFAIDNALLSMRCAGYLVLIALVILAHLRFASYALPHRQIIVSTCISLVLIGLFLTTNHFAANNFSHIPRYNVALKPPIFKIAGSKNTASFFDLKKGFKTKVDEDASPP